MSGFLQRASLFTLAATVALGGIACGGLAASSSRDAAVEDALGSDAVVDAEAPLCRVSGDTIGWSRRESGTTSDLHAVRGSASRDVWAVGAGGTIAHWNGVAWSATANVGGAIDLRGVWASGPDDAWAVGSPERGPAALHWDGKRWGAVMLPVSASIEPAWNGVWGSAPDDVWAVGGDRGALILHWDGSAWSSTPAPSLSGARAYQLASVAGSGADDVWAVGSLVSGVGYVIVHWDGSTWSLAPSSPTLAQGSGSFDALWIDGAEDGWAVGSFIETDGAGSFAARWNGKSWRSSGASGGSLWTGNPAPYPDLRGVWGSAPDNVWAVGPRGLVYQGSGVVPGPSTLARWTGRGWSVAGSCPTGNLNGVWGASSDDVWVVGDGGVILHRG